MPLLTGTAYLGKTFKKSFPCFMNYVWIRSSGRSSEIDKEACGRTMASPDSKRSAQQPCMMVRPLTFGRGTFLQATTLEKEGEKVLGGFPTITTMSSGTRNRLGQDKD